LDCLPKVDWVIIMNKGKIDYDGTYEELLQTDYYKSIKGSLDSAHMKDDSSFSESDSFSKEEIKEEAPKEWKSFLSTKGTEIIVKENKEDVPITMKTYISYYFYTFWIGMVFCATLIVTFIGSGSRVFYEYNLLYWV